MKKTTLPVIIILLVVISVNVTSAQSIVDRIVDKGLKAGINYATFGGADADADDMEPERILRFVLGAYITFQLNETIAIRPEAHYSMKGVHYEESESILGSDYDIKMDMKLNYLDIPILGLYSLQDNLKVYAGPSLGFYMNGETYVKLSYDGESESDTEDIESGDITSPDFGVVLGGIYSLQNNLTIDVRYSLGLKTIDDDEDIDFKNSVLQLMVGYSL